MYLYSRYAADKESALFAEGVIDGIMDAVGDDTPADYAKGLAGFGTGLEFLVRNGFIEADTDEILQDLDLLVASVVKRGPRPSDITGYVKYLTARLAGRDAGNDMYAANMETLGRLLSLSDKPFGSYSAVMGTIDILSDVYGIWRVQDEISGRIDNAVRRLEYAVRDDLRFGCYPGTFNPLVAAFVLSRAFEKTAVASYRDRASAMLEEYGRDFGKYLANDSCGLVSGSLKWAVLYRYLGERFPETPCREAARVWLERCLEKRDLFTGSCGSMPVGALDGYAGIGLSLLWLAGGISDGWTDIIPLYYERGKVTFTL